MATRELHVPTAADFNIEFPGLRPELALEGKQVAASPEEQRYRSLIAEVFEIEEARGTTTASVINMNPFRLKVNGVLHDDLVVPACPDDAAYVQYPIPYFKMDKKDLGDGVFIPYAEPPIKLAYDFEREFYEHGGVFFVPGIQPLSEIMDKEVKRNIKGEPLQNVKHLFDIAEKRMLKYCWAKYHEANTEWAKPNGQRAIVNEIHRRSVLTLMKAGELKDKPVWVAMKPGEGKQLQKCPACKHDAEAGAIIHSCGYVWDVIEAYDLGMISHDHTAIRRMGAEQMLARGLDPAAYLPGYKLADEAPKETAAEKKAREKAEKEAAKAAGASD